MTVGEDIKEVYQDVGSAFTIIRPTRTIRGEYLKYNPNSQVTKPFIREFFLEANLQYDTSAVPGDVLEVTVPRNRYMLMNRTPYMVENEVILYSCVLYKTNVKINIERPTEERDSASYLMRTTWEMIKQNVDALLTEPMFGITLETDEALGLLGIDRGELYVPASYGIQKLDRLRIYGTNEYYRVEAVKKRRYEDVDVVDIGEDTRPVSTTTTTTTSTTTTSVSSTSTTTTTTA